MAPPLKNSSTMEEQEGERWRVSTPLPLGAESPMDESLSSSPLSLLSKSPSPPSAEALSRPQPEIDDPTNRYPSPTITAPSGSQSPIKMAPHLEDVEIRVNTSSEPPMSDDPPPRKKRRTNPPKPRTTEYLDLGNLNEENMTHDEAALLDRLLQTLRKKKKIVVIAGAGISVSAGIPDFRSSHGLFRSLKSQHKLKGSGKHLFDAGVYRDDSSTQNFHTMVRELASLTTAAKPTPFHHLLASLAEEGRLLRLYTQNVDCIDTNMKPLATRVPLHPKAPWPKTIQLHGGLEHMVCTKCGHLDAFNGELFKSHEPPLCPLCKETEDLRINIAKKRSQGVGRLRPRIVLYNESNPDETAIGNVSMSDLRSRPDAVLVVGTSLKIPSVRRLVRELCKVTRDRRDGLAVWINLDAEPQGVEFKDCWDLVIRGKCDDVAELAQLPRWDEQEGVENAELSEEEEKVKELLLKRDTLEVQILPRLPEQTTPGKLDTILDKKFKGVEQVQGIPTPGASPQLCATKAPKITIKKTTQSKLAFASKNANQSQPAPARLRKKLPSEPVRKPLPMGQPPRTKLPTQPTRKAIPAKRPSSVLPPAKAKKQMKDRVKSHKVTEAFKTKKSTVSRATPPPKKLAAVNASPATPESDSSLSDILSDSIMPELPEPGLPALSGLPDLRPPKRSISESFRYTMESKVAATLDSSGSELSAPPSTPTRPIVGSEGIVSPISVPRNMAHLID